MSRVLRNALCAAALVGGTMLVTNHVVSQQEQPSHDDIMAAWMELAEPGPQHTLMERGVGKWKQTNTHWNFMSPDSPPDVSESRCDVKSIMGGRFVVSKTKGKFDMGGQVVDFEGMGIFGYDNGLKKYFFAWVDNLGTMMMTGYGDANADGNVVTYYSDMTDPMSGQPMKFKSVSTFVNEDEQRFEMFMKTPDGWTKNMQIDSKRVN